MSPALVSGLLLFAPPAQTQAVKATVTYTSPGLPAGRLLKELSVKTGLTLTTSPKTDGDVLALHVQDAPVAEVLKRIAWAVGGSWKKEGETYRLVRTAEEARAEQNRERAHVLAGFGNALKKRQTDLAKAGEFTPAKSEALAKEAATAIRNFNPEQRTQNSFWTFSQRLSNEAPVGRAMTRILSLLTPADLVDLPKGFKIVYSSNPTRTQRPLSGKIMPIIATLQREQTIWIESMARHNVKNPTFGDMTYILNGVHDADQPIEKVGKVLLTATRNRFAQGGVRLELIVADVRGKIVSRGNAHIGPDFSSLIPSADAPKDDPKVKRPADAKAIVEASTNRNGTGKPLPAELRNRLLRPEEHEPLAIYAGAGHIALAEARKANLVAALSDMNVYGTLFWQKEVGLTPLLKSLRANYEVLDEGGWLALRPIEAANARALRADRRAMGQYLRRKAQGKRMTVEEQAAWASRLPPDDEAPLIRQIASLVEANEDRYRYSDHRLLRLFGSLSKQQRAMARNGGVPFRSLMPDQLRLVQEMLYGENVFLQVDYQKAQEAKLDVNQYYNGLLREPTESLPDGIPPDGVLVILEQSDEVAFTGDTTTQGYIMASRGMTPSEMAWQRFSTSRLDLFPWAKQPYNQVDLNRLRLGKRTTYTIQLKFTPLLTQHHQLEDREYTVSDPIPYDRLPAAFRKQVDEAVAQYEKSYANHKPGAPATTGTPPPP